MSKPVHISPEANSCPQHALVTLIYATWGFMRLYRKLLTGASTTLYACTKVHRNNRLAECPSPVKMQGMENPKIRAAGGGGPALLLLILCATG